jgi:hypothetical protein
MKQSIYTTIAYRNPREAFNFLSENGYNKMKKDPQVIAVALADYVNKNKESALPKLAELHPDKELFREISNPNPLQPIISNFEGCDGCDKYKNVDAPIETGKKFSLSPNTINIMIISSALVFTITALAIIIRKAK